MPHNERLATAASELGGRIAAAGHTLLYGGSNLGLMGVVSGAAMEQGGHVVAVIPTLFGEEIIQSQQVSEIIRVRTMAERKELLLAMGDAFIALPGGIGTIDEVSEVMVMNQLQLVEGRRVTDGSYRMKPMILLNIGGFYDAFLTQMQVVRDEGLMRSAAGLSAAGDVGECLKVLQERKGL